MLTQAQRRRFDERGVLSLPGLLPSVDVERNRGEVHRICEKLGCRRRQQWSWDPSLAPGRVSKRLKKWSDRRSFMTPALHDAMTSLAGGAALQPWSAKADLLVSRPSRRAGADGALGPDAPERTNRGTMPWHVDVPRLPQFGRVGVQMFTFLDTVAPGGGGTAVVTGSHRLLRGAALSISEVTEALKAEPFFKELLARDLSRTEGLFQVNGRVQGVDLEVHELTGEPGDVVLMDLWVLHSRCANTRPVPRLMMTQRFLVPEARGLMRTRYYEPPLV